MTTEDVLAHYGLPPESVRFLPPGPDLAERAADLADLIRQMNTTATITVATNYGRN